MALTRTEFEDAVRLHGPRLRLCLIQLTHGQVQDAEDLLQRTFECAWTKREQFQGGALEAWLRTIARYLHLTHRRGLARSERLKAEVLLEWADGVVLSAPSGLDDRALQRCLDRLPRVDRRIIGLYYGRDDSEGRPPDQGGPPRPATDRDIACHLSEGQGHPWTPSAVSKRRGRALARLSHCLERSGTSPHLSETTSRPDGHPEHPSRWSPAMVHRRLFPVRGLPRLVLARLLVDPETPSLQWARQSLDVDEYSRRALARMIRLEVELASQRWNDAMRQAGGASPPPLPPGLEERLLAIADRPEKIARSVSSVKATPLRIGRRVLAVAALVLLAIGVRAWHDHRRSGEMVSSPSAERGSDIAVERSGIPLKLLVQSKPEGLAWPARLEPRQPGRWMARIPRESRIQIRVQRPEHVAPGATWTATLTLSRLDRRTGSRTPLDLEPFIDTAASTAIDIAVGPAIDMAGLYQTGFGSEDRLVLEIERGREHFEVEVDFPL